MPAPIHEEYEELVFEFSENGGTTWARNCVIMNAEVQRQTASEDVETVRDCADESLPNNISSRVRSISVSVSGTGNWTQGGYNQFLAKFYAGDSEQMLCRIGNLGAATGEIEYEQGPIIIETLGQSRTKGQVVSATIGLKFATTPAVTLKA